ncbi:hypothetical protein BKA69DRAFT_1069458 [Paraphysoderma sedebokerense]|nr:hypothetical protein BKA69DRAFT_1069458 [Paraphysoderma sedebokerense]
MNSKVGFYFALVFLLVAALLSFESGNALSNAQLLPNPFRRNTSSSATASTPTQSLPTSSGTPSNEATPPPTSTPPPSSSSSAPPSSSSVASNSSTTPTPTPTPSPTPSPPPANPSPPPAPPVEKPPKPDGNLTASQEQSSQSTVLIPVIAIVASCALLVTLGGAYIVRRRSEKDDFGNLKKSVKRFTFNSAPSHHQPATPFSDSKKFNSPPPSYTGYRTHSPTESPRLSPRNRPMPPHNQYGQQHMSPVMGAAAVHPVHHAQSPVIRASPAPAPAPAQPHQPADYRPVQFSPELQHQQQHQQQLHFYPQAAAAPVAHQTNNRNMPWV